MSKEDFFWTDSQQAGERLNNSFVLFNDEPVYIERVPPAERGEIPMANIYKYPLGTRTVISLGDPGFHKYRKLPPLGWANFKTTKTAVYMRRSPRRSRVHGLNEENVHVRYFDKGGKLVGSPYGFDQVVKDEGYALGCKNDFPALEEVLAHIRENSALAVSNLYAVYRDSTGLRWLYREDDQVGLFSGSDTLNLLGKFAYLKEELAEDKTITITNFKEF